MNLRIISFLLLVLLIICNITKISCDEDSDSDSDNSEEEEDEEDVRLKSEEDNDDKSLQKMKPISTNIKFKTKNKANAEEDKNLQAQLQTIDTEERPKSVCNKMCQKNTFKKFNQNCVAIKYKYSDKTKTSDDCMTKCKTDGFCVSTVFVEPKIPTTFDLKSLYNQVIDSENWVSLKSPGSLFKFYSEIGQKVEGLEEEFDKKEKLENNGEIHPKINTSALKTVGEVKGSCLLYEDILTEEQKFDCSSSHSNFFYNQIDCTEDPECIQPRKECERGRCGPHCKDYTYIRIPNTCLGKYFFGYKTAETLESCLEFCVSNKDCKSIDFGNNGSCLINHVTRNDSQLISGCESKNNEKWDYYEIITDSECAFEKPQPPAPEDTCANIPNICKNGGFCESIQNPPPQQSFTYGCQCPCNFCGKHCEKLNLKTFKNGCLNNSVLVWSVAENSEDCLDMCLNEIHCKSVSYSSSSGTCALHWADHQTEALMPSNQCPTYRADITEKEWTYYEIMCNTSTCYSSVEVIESKEMKGCDSNPCVNGGECADIYQSGKLIGYHCLCKCGYCGDRCETQNFIQTPSACIWGAHISDSPEDYYRSSVTVKECLNVCASKYPLCRSIDHSNKGQCFLNNRDSESGVVNKRCNNYLRQKWTLYDLSCGCNNKPMLF